MNRKNEEEREEKGGKKATVRKDKEGLERSWPLFITTADRSCSKCDTNVLINKTPS